jgi:hypothetical protein
VVVLTSMPSATALGVPTLESCGAFNVDADRSTATLTAGQPAVAVWVPVQGAVRYRIELIDEFGMQLMTDYAVEPTYSFPADLFETGKRYGWSVYPEDSLSQQMCYSVGGEFFPAPQ